MNNRRKLAMALGASLLAVSVVSYAQQQNKVGRVGILCPSACNGSSVADFKRGLLGLGYVEGQSITFDYRDAEGNYDLLPKLAKELVNLKVDVIFTSWGTPPAIAAKNATQSIPIVFVGVGDAVGVGLVTNLRQPGGNVTGITMISEETVAKQLELIRELAPKIKLVGVVFNPVNPVYGPVLKEVDSMGQTLGLRIRRLSVQQPEELEDAFKGASADRAGGLIVFRDPMLVAHQARLIDLARKYRLPTIYGMEEFAYAGGLMSYGPNVPDIYRRAVTYVDKILKGAKPHDLPVEQAMLFNMVINMKTAKALGIKIPNSILVRADKVIE